MDLSFTLSKHLLYCESLITSETILVCYFLALVLDRLADLNVLSTIFYMAHAQFASEPKKAFLKNGRLTQFTYFLN